MRTEAPSGLVICNLPRSRSPLRVASPGKPLLREVPPFLPALLHQLQNHLEIAWAINVVFTHVLPWSRLAVFVEGNFLMANQARNILPFFSSSASRRWRGAPHQAIILIVHKQRPNPPSRSLTPFSLGARLLLHLDLDGRFPSPLPGLFCCNVFPRIRTRPPPPIPPFQTGPPPPGYRCSRPYCVAGLLLLCLQLAATRCWRFCKWWVGVLGRAISEHSNRNVSLPKPLGRTTVLLQQQRPATGEQRVRTT